MPPLEPAPPKDSEKVLEECEAIEAELAALKVAYEQYFLGADRHPPLRVHEALKKRVVRLQTGFTRNTATKFRVQALQSKFLTYERLWQRTLQEIESGTYKRDLAKARRRAAKLGDPRAAAASAPAARGPVQLDEDPDFDLDQALAGLEAAEAPLPQPIIKVQVAAPVQPPQVPGAARPAAAASPALPPAPPIPSTTRPGTGSAPPGLRAPAGAPVPAASAPRVPSNPTPPPMRAVALGPALLPTPAAAAAGAQGISEDKLRAVYDAYVTAKRRCQEDTSKLSFESVAGNLRRQVPELMRQHNAKAVEFKVVIKDGKAVLKAVPK